MVNDPSVPDADNELNPDVYNDKYLNIILSIPSDSDGPEFSWLTRRLREMNWLPIGKSSDKPILGTHMYEVEYPDGHKETLSKNAISENMFYRVDGKGSRYILFEEIIDHINDG